MNWKNSQLCVIITVVLLFALPRDIDAATTNLALNPSRSGLPSPLESDNGWGAGADKWDLVDGITQYDSWQEGLAFTGGELPWVEPAGQRQATLNLGNAAKIEQVVAWHHGGNDVPMNASLEAWSSGEWQTIFSRHFDADYETSSNGWSRPDTYRFQPVEGTKLRYSFDNRELSFSGNPMRHGWIYELEVMGTSGDGDEGNKTNVAFNSSRSGLPDPMESDDGWGGGADKWDIVDGITQYDDWAEGLAFTPGGMRQATISFDDNVTFDEVVVWHHGGNDVPSIASLEFFSGGDWQTIFSRNFDADYVTTTDGWSRPDTYSFQPIEGGKLRYSFDNSELSLSGNPMRHGWLYELEVLGTKLGNADFDLDGDVDGDDFLTWQTGFAMETGATLADGDCDGDGDVDGDDFLIWQSSFGSGDSGTGTIGAIPEPSAIVLVSTAAVALTFILGRPKRHDVGFQF